MNQFSSHAPQYRWIILGCCLLAYASSYLIRWSYTGLAPLIREDFSLDKATLGLLGAAFFYPYALAQVPWGKTTDHWGGRMVISFGVLASAVGLGLFATSQNFEQTILWRMVVGVVAASAFVPIASLLAQWFSAQERGLANGIYYGLGGGIGEIAAFLLLPVLHLYLASNSSFPFSGWRGATVLIASSLIGIGLLCLSLLRSYPPSPVASQKLTPTVAPWSSGHTRTIPAQEPSSHVLRDPVLWLLGGYFAAGIIALRLVPGWLTIFSNDAYRIQSGYSPSEAMIAGGIIGTIYTFGHIAGSPLLGSMSDGLAQHGHHRLLFASGILGLGAIGIFLLTLPLSSGWMLGILAFILGVALHAFPVINAAVTDRWGIHHTGERLGWINMVGQLAGAFALSISGYVGIALSNEPGNPLGEYTGIWHLGALSCAVGAGCGWAAHILTKQKPGST